MTSVGRYAVLGYLIAALASSAAAMASQPDPLVAAKMIQALNETRQQAGLAPVALNPRLMQVAQSLAADLAARQILSHIDSGGNGLGDRFVRADYVYAVADEALADGGPAPDAVVAQWLASPLDRDSLLNPEVRDAGVGYAVGPAGTPGLNPSGPRHFWVLDLGLAVERGPGP